jgi:ribosomal protection tetracycline resistance protein
LNLGILAHVDAGKTSLTERLLLGAGVIDELGSVDDGNTQTDSLALERARGITIKSAVVSFAVEDVTINLIDTPGHPDFIAEVERVLSVLDGAVLVVSAVEGVQAQTRVLMRALQRLQVPTLFFVNKLDRRGADLARVRAEIAAKLTPAVVSPDASASEVLADRDDDFLAAYLDGEGDWRAELAAQTARAVVHPLYAGSAITGAGVEDLVAGIRAYLPSRSPDPVGPVSGSVFKVERGAAGEKVAIVQLRSGTVRVRERIGSQKVTAISVFGSDRRDDALRAGEIGRLWGLDDVRIGDAIGDATATNGQLFAPPTLETVVFPRDEADRGALHVALTRLAEQDPLINLREGDETRVSLYGEVQKEVIEATLADEFGIAAGFRETTTILIEKPAGSGSAVEFIEQGDHGFLATVGLRVDPGPTEFRLEVELGSMPYAFFRAVEETVLATLERRRVRDCTVTMTHSGYWARQSSAHGVFDKSMSSTAGDFRGLTPLVLTEALRRAGTVVYEPLHRFTLELPADALGPVLPALGRLGAVPEPPVLRGDVCSLEGTIPAARVYSLQQELPGLTRGEGVMESAFERYEVMARSSRA